MSAKYQSAIWMDPCDNLLLGDGGYSFLLANFTWQKKINLRQVGLEHAISALHPLLQGY